MLGTVVCVAVTIRGATISLRVYGVVDLRQLPETQLQLDLILHVHDEGEGLDELRGSVGAALGQELEVRPSEPVSEPESYVEPAVRLLLDSIEQLPLFVRA